MKSKGFTIIEVLTTLVIISLLTLVISGIINTTLAASKEETYGLLKNNIITASNNYINECNAGIIECNFSNETNNSFYVSKLEEYGYFTDLESPIDGRYLGDCLLVKVKYDNGINVIDLEDKCY